MRRLTFALLLALIAGGATAAAGSPAYAANTLCVGSKPGCFSTIQSAVNAAHDGDTILVAPGTFAGGVTIDVSIRLVGAGANKTIIKGGGPVVMIGIAEQFPAAEPTVSIRGVTITAGVTTSGFLGDFFAAGGGVEIPPSCMTSPGCPSFDYGPGATVTIANSVITGNRVTPAATVLINNTPYAAAHGGGIANWGTTTLTNTTVSNNAAGSTASSSSLAAFVSGGGIATTFPGTLTLRHSIVSGNRAAVNAPNGVSPGAGGIAADGPLTVDDAVVSGNTVDLAGSGPGQSADAGGISVNWSATITRTIVRDNSVTASNLTDDALAFAGGIFDEGSLTLNYSTIDHNRVSATAPSSSSATAIAAGGGLLVFSEATVSNSLVSDNSISAVHPNGGVFVGGGGIGNNGQLTLQRTLVIHNSGTASGAGGASQGGGIRNDTFFGSIPQLTLTDSAVLANKLTASPGITPQGGGLFTTFPVTLTRTLIAGNQPDQCFGC